MPPPMSRYALLAALAGSLPALVLPVPARASDAAAATAPEAPPVDEWRAAIGVLGGFRTEYPGSAKTAFKLSPGYYFHWRRLTITNAGGFAPRRREEVARGLGVDMLQSEHLRVGLSLRYDGGRTAASNAAFAGLGDIRATLRARLNATWDVVGPWRLGASWNFDALGRGDGGTGDISLSWERRYGPDTRIQAGATLGLGDGSYMRKYYGITPAQSSTSVYPAYAAAAGLRDAGIGVSLQHDISRAWVVLASAHVSRMLGSAAGSPLTQRRDGWGAGGGLAWRF